MKRRTMSIAVLTAVAAAALSGCATGGADSGSGATAAPIVVGSINALSGPATFPEASAAAAAVFDAVNEAGGVDGRMIEYKALDDKGDPSTASAAARELIGQDGAVAMVGSASTVECAVNGAYYEQSGVLSVQGTGVEPECFQSPNIAPVNTGPFFGTSLALAYASETLGLERICGLFEITGSSEASYEKAIAAWSEATGKELAYTDMTIPFGASDYTPYIVKAKDQGCDGAFTMTVAPDVIGQMKAAAQQGWTDVTWVGLTSIFGDEFATAIGGDVGQGLYAIAEFSPYMDDSEANANWRELMTDAGVPLTSFSQGGYLAATYFIDVLRSIEGEITRESVTQALQEMSPITDPMVGTPYEFGTAQSHTPNRAGWPVALDVATGAWQNAGDGWLTLD